jgi:hypothetical protein
MTLIQFLSLLRFVERRRVDPPDLFNSNGSEIDLWLSRLRFETFVLCAFFAISNFRLGRNEMCRLGTKGIRRLPTNDVAYARAPNFFETNAVTSDEPNKSSRSLY